MAYYILTIAVVGLMITVIWHARISAYICKDCGHEFSLSPLEDFVSPQGLSTKYVKCPKCKKRTWADIIYKKGAK